MYLFVGPSKSIALIYSKATWGYMCMLTIPIITNKLVSSFAKLYFPWKIYLNLEI